jgi:DNA-directed RNA polymerase subunit M/transcription elongation factor TFIIS
MEIDGTYEPQPFLSFKRLIIFPELSTLNIFYLNEDSSKVIMSTASSDLPGPMFAFVDKYPRFRTSKRYKIADCEHSFVHESYRQIRRGDEAPSVVYRCEKCGTMKIK